MRTNQRWMKSFALTASVLGMTGAVHAQTVSLTSVTWNSLGGLTQSGQFFGTTLLAIPSGTFGAATLGVGASTSVTFPANSGFAITVGTLTGTSNGTQTGSFSFNVAGGPATISVPITYNIVNAVVGISSAPVNFSVGANNFSFLLNTSGTVSAPFSLENIPVTGLITFVSTAPEPGTLALFGLGIAPIAIAIRRRRK